MLKTADIEMKLMQCEQGQFQKICNEILCKNGYKPYNYTGSVKGTNKTKLGTPDSVFIDKDNNGKYIYVEFTTQKTKLKAKILSDVDKCLKKIEKNNILTGKIKKIIFMHNNDNPDETFIEKVKKKCGKDISFEIYGINYLSNELQNNCKDIAISHLGLIDSNIQISNGFSDDDINKLCQAISKKEFKEYNKKSEKEIKNKINSLYEEAANIVNNNDAILYISNDNKNKLKKIFDSLSILDFYYENKEDFDSRIYYRNMFIILSKVNIIDGINYYLSLPKYIIDDIETKHYYCMLLLQNEEYENANIILKKLYFEDKYENSFETLIRSFFLLKQYDNIIELLSSAKKEKYDKYGFLASMLIIAKNKKHKYSEKEILKLNNSKFKDMPIFFSCTSKLLYDLNQKNNKYKQQFKKGIKLLNQNDIVVIETMCNQSMEMQLEDEMISYLESIKLSKVLELKLLELLSNKKELKEKDIKFIDIVDFKSLDDSIDCEYLLAKVSESKGKELDAIKKYKISYEKKDNDLAGFKYIQLTIKNKSKIDENIISKISKSRNVNDLMLAAQAYDYIGKKSESLNCSYRALYLSKGLTKYKDIFKQYWFILTLNNKKLSDLNHIINDSVVILKNVRTSKNIIYILENDEFFNENDKIFESIIIRSYSDIGSELLGREKNEKIIINNKEYTIVDIIDKYEYFGQVCFKYVKENQYLKFFTSDKEKPEDSIEQIREEMIKINNDTNRRLDIYQNNNNIPLSALINDEYNFDSYAKLINTLLSDPERILLAGENIDIDLNSGFVIDISSLIILSILDMLNIIPEKIYKKIYISLSLKNKFQFFYEKLIDNQDENEKSLYITNKDKLALSEIKVIDQIKFWKKLNNFLNKINIVEIECEKDDLYNDKSKGFFDKTQFDLINVSKELNLPFVCDDLMIRKVSNNYNIKHTNITQLIKEFCKEDEYYNSIIKLIKCNYIYALYDNTLSQMLGNLYINFNDENKKRFESIINSIFENKTNIIYYKPILLNRLKSIKEVQYIKIYNKTYENLFATFYINTINDKVTEICDKFNIDISD